MTSQYSLSYAPTSQCPFFAARGPALPYPQAFFRSFRLHPRPFCNTLFCGAKRAAGEERSGGMGAPLIIWALPRSEREDRGDANARVDNILQLVSQLIFPKTVFGPLIFDVSNIAKFCAWCVQDCLFTWKELPKSTAERKPLLIRS